VSENTNATQPVTRHAPPPRLPSLEILSGAQAGTVLWLPPNCIVGRVEGCDLVLDDASVSRRHARFFEQDGRTWVEDLGSPNGVMVGQEDLRPLRLVPLAAP
jgi:pSer/pThr/pTyr-binding forkhead associated (FHA) protein